MRDILWECRDGANIGMFMEGNAILSYLAAIEGNGSATAGTLPGASILQLKCEGNACTQSWNICHAFYWSQTFPGKE